ncbi:hypothetical protein ACSV5M_08575 [Cellvibrio sp. ARAG 10.3]|uniref:hypothetical protein n=1 Tax=Cellvibrio sp. ARAG 10.3 TaxID=3451358 RepID=UPI003F45A0CD
MEFDIGKWLGRILYEPGYYSDLCQYVKSDEHLNSHLESRTIFSFEDGEKKISDLNPEFKKHLVDGLASSVVSAVDTLSTQMIVVAVTLTEGIMSEFLESLFCKKPERMHDFLAHGNVRGVIPMSIILESDSKQEIIAKLAKICSAKAMEGKFEKSISRIESLSNSHLGHEIKNKLIELARKRNQIIHEAKMLGIEESDVKQAYDLMYSFLRWLGIAAVKNGVPVYDPGGLVK